ncbi:MAG: beta galactosidase jelly roll domain-containing protein [Clostridia bacterium]|nr:beta galactosidase jelly roll domain-containing protein [Clostridia bacterium]MBR3716241.1 beta galactosidase jelly roll domain-containing protein [Clostridia bacterium]
MNTEKIIPRSEYPRPDRVREDWLCLNGQWDFAFDETGKGISENWMNRKSLDTEITVPFVYQCELSGVNDLRHSDFVWYHRTFTVPSSFEGKRVILHFGAVDYKTKVWLNGRFIGEHEGGYTPFAFDITYDVVDRNATYDLTVLCEDRLEVEYPRGKQSFRPENFECWYAPMTGIWQSVWLEAVGMKYIDDIRITPDVDNSCFKVEALLNEIPANGTLGIEVSFRGNFVTALTLNVTRRRVDTTIYFPHNGINLEGFFCWEPYAPNLYDIKFTLTENGAVADTLSSYFGMRKIQCEGGKIYINNHELYQRLILDQGYWPDGLLTAPTDEALKKDIELTMQLGYNGARKHQKFEDPRYLYWADKLGLIVWEELPSPYLFSDVMKRNCFRDMQEAIKRDYNHPCIITWVPMNESWGIYRVKTNREQQQFTDALYFMIHSLDDTRIVSTNDGWEQTETDIVTVHDYAPFTSDLTPEYASEEGILTGVPNKYRTIVCDDYDLSGKPMLMTEYGGIALAKDKHGANWGYGGAENDEEKFFERFENITMGFKNCDYFCGYCYTQLTDVFQEVNGLLDMDRNPKMDMERVRKINLKRR